MKPSRLLGCEREGFILWVSLSQSKPQDYEAVEEKLVDDLARFLILVARDLNGKEVKAGRSVDKPIEKELKNFG